MKMRLKLSTEEFSTALQKASEFTGKGREMEITKDIMLVASDGFLYINASNITSACKIRVPCDIQKEGALVVEGKIINLVKTIRKDDISLSLTNSNKLSINSNFYLGVRSNGVDKFPEMPLPSKDTKSFDIPRDEFIEEVQKVDFACNNSDMDMEGMVFLGGNITYATNKYKFACLQEPQFDFECFFPKSFIRQISDLSNEFKLFIEDGRIYVNDEDLFFMMKVPSIAAPRSGVEQLLNKELNVAAIYDFDIKELIHKIRQIRTLNSLVTMYFTEDKIYMAGNDNTENISHSLQSVNLKAKEFKEETLTTYTIKYLLDCLRGFDKPEITIEAGNKGITYFQENDLVGALASTKCRNRDKILDMIKEG